MKKLLAIGALVLVVLMGAGLIFQWQYDDAVVRLGSLGPPQRVKVRTSRLSGRTEYLSGEGWLPLESRSTEADRAVEEMLHPTLVDLPDDLMTTRIIGQGGILGLPYAQKLVVTVVNGTDWEVAEILVRLDYMASDGAGIPRLVTLKKSEFGTSTIAPGEGTTLEWNLRDPIHEGATWQIVGARGFKRKGHS
jgi:hypothetical protein